jgi:ribosomal protein S18 acetylase RimI-like enzyme
MSNAHLIVNKLLEADPDAPEPYVDWLSQKVDTGPLDKIRFGAYIHLSDEQMIRENAAEAGIDVDSQAFWDEIERCMAIMESHCLQLLREAGLHVSDEGHDETGARVASVWIDTPEEDRKLALLKAVINWAEGDWPSTTSGTMDYAFGADTTQRIYAATEDAARFIDVTIEFSGTDALVEWSRLNLNEAIKGDPDDPDVFLRSYVPRMLGRLLIEFNIIKPHFPDAPTNWYRERVDGMDLFRYNRASEMKEVMRQMRAYNRQRGERAGIDQVTYRYKVPNPQGSSIVRQWLDKLGCPPTVIQWACETNPPIWFWVPVKEFNAYMQMVYPQVKLDPVVEGIDDPDDPEAFVKSYRKIYYSLFYGRKFGEGAFVGVYNSLEAAVTAAKERKLRRRARHVWVVEDAHPDATDDNVIVGSAPTGIVYDILQGYKVSEPRRVVIESTPDEEADPRAYLDAVTGWIDTFVKAGMTRYDTDTHKDQLWKTYEVPGFNYWIYVHLREPKWIIVERNDALYGRNIFRRVFEFPDRDINGMVNAFSVLDRKLTKARTRATDDFPAVDDEIDQLYQQHKRRRERWLSGKIKEAVDDPEVQRYLDQASPEACKSCGNDLTQRHSVVREYVQSNGLTHELSGHYAAHDSGYENDEQPSANLLAALPVCPTFNDLCARCGQDPNRPPQHESVDDPEAYVRDLPVYTMDEIRDKMQDYGLSFHSDMAGFMPWGRWVAIKGFAYWAVTKKGEYLPADFFRTQLEKFCKDMGFTVYHVQIFNEPPVPIEFRLAIPKIQVDPESWETKRNILNDPDRREQAQVHNLIQSEWLPEGAPDDPDDPAVNVERHTADLDIHAVMAKLGFTDGRTRGATWDGWFKRVGNKEWRVWPTVNTNVYGVTRVERPAKFVQVGRGRRYGQWSDKGHFTCHVSELEQQLREEGALNPPPVDEAVDPDDPSVNVDRHMAALDIHKIMTDLGFGERWPSWKCADPEYMWFEKFTGGLKWTVIRKSDDEPQMFTVSVYKPRKLPGAPLMDYEEIGGGTFHVGELAAKLRSALPKKDPGYGFQEALGVPDPDAPEPNIERFAQHVEKTEAEALESAIDIAVREFEFRIDKQGVDNARRADEIAAEVGNECAEMAGYRNGSDEYDWVVSAVNNRAGEMFPGDWEDYPVQEAKADEQAWPLPGGFKIVRYSDENTLELRTPKGRPVGLIAWRSASDRVGIKYRTIELEHLEVDPRFQNRGLGKALVRQFVKLVPQLYPDAKFVVAKTATSQGIVDLLREIFGPEIKSRDVDTLPVRSPDDWIHTMNRGYALFRLGEADEGDPERYIKSLPIPIRATCIGDGMEGAERLEAAFDAADWFEQATLEQLLVLAKQEFQSSYEADAVGEYFFDTQLKDWYENYQGEGFEVYINEQDVKLWIEHNRPDWYAYLWPGEIQIKESVDDPDDPQQFIQHMETDWRKILRQHGFKPQPHSDHLSYALTYPDRVWGANWPVNIYAHHGWNPHPEFEYDHPDPDNPDLDAEDAAYDEWQRNNDEFAAIRQRDIAFPDYIAFQFGREYHRRLEVPVSQLDSFLTRLVAGAKKVVGTETIASVHQGRGLTEMLWEVGKAAARELKIPVKESVDDTVDPADYAASTFNVGEMLQRMGYEQNGGYPEWFKVFRRMPTELDLMIEVKRRGQGGEENEGDVLYDITLYRYPVNDNPNRIWEPFVYRYGRNNLQLERVVKRLEERIKANNLRGIRDEVDESVPIPPEDEPENALPSMDKSLVKAELQRLDFGPKPERGIEWIYQEEMPRFWWNKYEGADGKPHGIYINFVSGQTPELQTRNYNPDAKAWFVKGQEGPLQCPAESPAHLAAIVRDLDDTMKRSAAESLPPEQEYEALKRVIDHHRKWWEDTLDYLIAQDNRLPGRIGPGQPA